jgi:hypothetical protein
MSDGKLSLYETADWGARIAGATSARRDAAGTLFLDEVQVESVSVNGQFSVLRCIDGSTKVVLSSFLRLVPKPVEHR